MLVQAEWEYYRSNMGGERAEVICVVGFVAGGTQTIHVKVGELYQQYLHYLLCSIKAGKAVLPNSAGLVAVGSWYSPPTTSSIRYSSPSLVGHNRGPSCKAPGA